MDAISEIIRHNSWATARLIEHLRSMPPETLDLSAPGTYGPIGETLAHLLRAERAYLAHVKGDKPTFGQRTQNLAQLADEARSLGEQWEYLLQVGVNPDLEAETMHGVQPVRTLLAQVVNHATEHRAHVCTVLGTHGMTTPALDAFSYRAAVREGL
ncbi:MAG TPA: DinB family protein [Candidatus Nitrosotalea sp.]|nr:DinB family protein [Candidatus Nitrosotalea sp.]